MSKHDTHFFNTFSVIIGLLIVVAIMILAFARVVAGRTQIPETYVDPKYLDTVADRTAPFVHVAVAGQDNSALKIAAPVQSVAIALAVPADGPALYDAVCKTCHATGLVGSPKLGDHKAWAPRLALGKAALYEHALKGYAGKAGVMPAKGGRTDLSDELVKQGVDYLVSKAQ